LPCLWEQVHWNVQNDGRNRTVSFNMTKHRHIELCQYSNFWPLRTWLWSPTLLTRPIWPLMFICRVSPWGLWWTECHWDRFSPSSPANIIPPWFSLLIIIWEINNRPVGGWS
jgi:hypothetical protein